MVLFEDISKAEPKMSQFRATTIAKESLSIAGKFIVMLSKKPSVHPMRLRLRGSSDSNWSSAPSRKISFLTTSLFGSRSSSQFDGRRDSDSTSISSTPSVHFAQKRVSEMISNVTASLTGAITSRRPDREEGSKLSPWDTMRATRAATLNSNTEPQVDAGQSSISRVSSGMPICEASSVIDIVSEFADDVVVYISDEESFCDWNTGSNLITFE